MSLQQLPIRPSAHNDVPRAGMRPSMSSVFTLLCGLRSARRESVVIDIAGKLAPERTGEGWISCRERHSRAFAADATDAKTCEDLLAAMAWLRIADHDLCVDDPRHTALIRQTRRLAQRFADLPDAGTTILRAAAFSSDEALVVGDPPSTELPIVVCIGEDGMPKEELLCALWPLHERQGLTLLLIDPPGRLHTVEGESGYSHAQTTTIVSGWIDAVRGDADRPVGIFGFGIGNAYASEAAARDARISAAVGDAGAWGRHVTHHAQSSFVSRPAAGTVWPSCPTLVLAHEDWLPHRRFLQLPDGCDVTVDHRDRTDQSRHAGEDVIDSCRSALRWLGSMLARRNRQ